MMTSSPLHLPATRANASHGKKSNCLLRHLLMLRIGGQVIRRKLTRGLPMTAATMQEGATVMAQGRTARDVGSRSHASSSQINGTGSIASSSLASSSTGGVRQPARAPRPPRDASAPVYPLQSLRPPRNVRRWPFLVPGTPECTEFAESSKDGSMLSQSKADFHQSNEILAVSMPAREAASYRWQSCLQGSVLRVPRIRALINDPDDKQRRVLLLNVKELDQLPDEARQFLREEAESGRIQLKTTTVDVGYSYWSTDDVLSALLPIGLPEGTPTAFTTTGHLAHLNLREEYAAYRFLIGQVILDHNPHLRTVVNKLDTIDNEFRFFKMERLAGDDEYVVSLSESGCQFSFDFRTVYWNSRLHAEHERLIRLFQPYEVVSDVMAGVGPFAVPSARKGVYVLANDLNPASYESLKRNATKNRVDRRLQSFCEDGRAFIRESIKRCWQQPLPGKPLAIEDVTAELQQNTSRSRGKQEHDRLKEVKEQRSAASNGHAPDAGAASRDARAVSRAPPRRLIDHFVMNLPGSALEFLNAYRGAYKPIAGEELEAELQQRASAMKSEEDAWPMVHVHCFTKDLVHPHEDICGRTNRALGIDFGSHHALVAPPSPLPDLPDTRAEEEKVGEALSDLSLAESNTVKSSTLTRAPTPGLSLHLVRSVAPNKDMYCLSFRLTRAILFDALDS